jgi:hypothetical protein
MCDYSLAGLPNRLAVEGEQLVVQRFSTGALGLASPTTHRVSLWFKKECAVCVAPGARFLLRDIPQDLRRQFGVHATEEVTFVQVSAEAYRYRDAVRFRNGREVLLQWLRCGQQVEVLSLCAGDSWEEEHQRREEECRQVFAELV